MLPRVQQDLGFAACVRIRQYHQKINKNDHIHHHYGTQLPSSLPTPSQLALKYRWLPVIFHLCGQIFIEILSPGQWRSDRGLQWKSDLLHEQGDNKRATFDQVPNLLSDLQCQGTWQFAVVCYSLIICCSFFFIRSGLKLGPTLHLGLTASGWRILIFAKLGFYHIWFISSNHLKEKVLYLKATSYLGSTS